MLKFGFTTNCHNDTLITAHKGGGKGC
jgi:hypothetical protein